MTMFTDKKYWKMKEGARSFEWSVEGKKKDLLVSARVSCIVRCVALVVELRTILNTIGRHKKRRISGLTICTLLPSSSDFFMRVRSL